MATAAYIAASKPEAFLYVSVGPRLTPRFFASSLIVSVKALPLIRLPRVVLCFVILLSLSSPRVYVLCSALIVPDPTICQNQLELNS